MDSKTTFKKESLIPTYVLVILSYFHKIDVKIEQLQDFKDEIIWLPFFGGAKL